MATTVLAMSSAYAVGGWLYETGVARFGAQTAFDGLVGIGVVSTAACWFLAPRLLGALAGAR